LSIVSDYETHVRRQTAAQSLRAHQPSGNGTVIGKHTDNLTYPVFASKCRPRYATMNYARKPGRPRPPAPGSNARATPAGFIRATLKRAATSYHEVGAGIGEISSLGNQGRKLYTVTTYNNS